jgi:RNA-binding protein YlmH
MKEAVYAHFHREEQPFVQRMVDKIQQITTVHESFVSDFLDPRQQYIVQSLINRERDLQTVMNGGYESAERKRVWIAYDYEPHPDPEDAISLLEITSLDNRLTGYRHGDFLGSLLGLGIKREKLGDIHIDDNSCQVLIATEMADFVRLHMQKVGSVHVHVERIPLTNLREIPPALEELIITVPSLRIDGLISDVFKMSRTKAQLPIKAGRCRINWRVEESTSQMLQAGDVVSLQGWGRFKVLDIQGVTKKGNFRVKIGKFV